MPKDIDQIESKPFVLSKKSFFLGASLGKLKDLLATKKEILQCIADNIIDQNDSSLAALMSAFDLRPDEGLDARLEKLSSLFDVYDVDYCHELTEKWYDFHSMSSNSTSC